MYLFEQYQKDWKQVKAKPNSNLLSNLKNKEIMEQLILFEQAEVKGIKKGIVGGTIGILIGSVCGVRGIVLDEVTITPTIIGGIILMFFSLFFSAYHMLQKEQFQASDQTTANYLKLAKERLITRKHKIKRYYIFYVILLTIGIGMVTSMLPYFVFGAIVFGGVFYCFWDVKKDPYLIKQLAELDHKISNLK